MVSSGENSSLLGDKKTKPTWVKIVGILAVVTGLVGLHMFTVSFVTHDNIKDAPIRALSSVQCAARNTQQLFADVFQGTKAPKRIRVLLQQDEQLTGPDEVGVPPLDQLVEKMSLDEQIGQILQPENWNAKCYQITDEKLGAVFFGGNSNPGGDDPISWHKRANQIQHEALRAKPHHIPVFIGVDTIHGMSHMKQATLFPHNLGLGCTRNPELVEKIGRITALEAAAVDVNWGFTPCVALATDIRWGRIYESFGQDPDLVGEMGGAFVKGANSIDKPFVTCGKHFVADGGTQFGTGRAGRAVDRGNWKGGMKELRETHMKPYEYLVKAGVKSIMASFSSVNGSLMHGNKELIDGELKGRLGFKGFVSSDYDAINFLDKNYDKAVAKAINAGIDQIMFTGGPHQLGQIIKNNVEQGEISKERIKDAARRVLWAKFESGLMDQQPKNDLISKLMVKQSETDQNLLDGDLAIIGSAAHRAVARQAVQESTVILKNEKAVLPLNIKEKKVCVIGGAANNAGNMLGGWTLNWQGHSGKVDTQTTTVAQAIHQHAYAKGVSQNYKYVEKPHECEGSDVALVVIGEHPYAEWVGDVTRMPWVPETDFVGKLKDQMPVVLLSISGRPVDVQDAVGKATAFAVSFVPGSEGGLGITDVLFGDVAPKGKLSLDWPKSGHALVRIADPKTLLYKYGDGLTWTSEKNAQDTVASTEAAAPQPPIRV